MGAMSLAELKPKRSSQMKPASVWQTPFTLVSAGCAAHDDDAIALVTIFAVGLPRRDRSVLRLGSN